MARRTKAKADPSVNGHGARMPVELPPAEEADGSLKGRLLSEVKPGSVQWLLHPWIPIGMLTLVVGMPNVGKSTFLASLVAYITGGPGLGGVNGERLAKVVMLTGYEEDVEVMTAPRLIAAGVVVHRVKLIDDPGVKMPRDKKKLLKAVKSFGALALLIDPIDSYLDEGVKENDGPSVREALEAFAWVGMQGKCAVVGVRHPGKDATNVMVGSRQWRAVPRSIIQLTTDDGFPPRFMLSHFRDALGTHSTPRRYTLEGEEGKPKRFALTETVERSAEELSKSLGGPVGRWKLMQACRLIRWLFKEEGEPTRSMLGDEARKQGLGEDTVNEALRLLSVKSVPPSERGLPWKLVRTVEEWPSWLPEVSPP